MSTGISIIGYACRLPGAANADAFWQLLYEGRTSVSKIPSGRFATKRYLHPVRSVPGKSINFCAGVLDDIYSFDAGFFGMSPREAIQTDPQQRLLLQIVWECLEHAGIPPSSLAGKRVGVFVGAASWDYLFNFVLDPLSMDAQTMTGNTLSIISNRVSYFLDLKGPSFTVDTACSSSLVALGQACEAINSEVIDTAIVAGVHLLAAPFPFAGFSRAFMLSANGRCSAFDAAGDGYVRGEGAAAFILQSTKAARLAERTIHANIVGWGTNQDGRTVGLSLPSSESQATLLRETYQRFDLDPARLAFVEAHGTGTRVGDPAEANSIGRSLAAGRVSPLLIGSVKTNIGHLEPASGVAGLMKAVLSLKRGILPPSLHFSTPNPDIAFKELNLEVATTLKKLPTNKFALAGVNSFGFGGSNAHVVLEKPKDRSPRKKKRATPIPLALSARGPEALRAMADRYLNAIRETPESFGSFCNKAAYGRDHLEHRAIILPSGPTEMLASLEAVAHGRSTKGALLGKAKLKTLKIAFAFSGNGSQWPGMGVAAFRHNAEFRDSMQQVDRLFSKLTDWSLVEVLHAEDLAERLKTASVAQALLFAIQVSLVNALKAFGIEPCVTLGHSAGEVAAAWASGALNLEQAVKVIHARSSCQEVGRGKGSMAAVVVSKEQAEQLFRQGELAGLEIAAVNTGRSITVTGAHKELDLFTKYARQQRWPFRRIDVDYAYHSHFADPVQGELIASLRDLKSNTGTIPFVSSVYGRVVVGEELDADYWWKNVRHTVDFKSATEVALGHGTDLVLEIGPSPVLTGYISDITKQAGSPIPVLPTLDRKEADSIDPVLTSAAGAFVNGANVSLQRMFGPCINSGIELPTYSWQNIEYRVQSSREALTALSDAIHPLLGVPPRMDSSTYFSHIDLDALPWLKDHQVGGAVVFPGTAILETALAAARESLGEGPLELRNCAIFRPMVLEGGVVRDLMTRVAPEERTIDLLSRPRGSSEEWTHHARARFCRPPPLKLKLDPIPADSEGAVDSAAVYQIIEKFGFRYGPSFRRLKSVSLGDQRHSVAVLAPSILDEGFLFDPTIVDSALHGTLFSFFARMGASGDGRSYVPTRIESLRLYQPGRAVLRCQISLSGTPGASASADLVFLADDDSVVAVAQGGQFAALPLSGSEEQPHFYRTIPVPLRTAGHSLHGSLAPAGLMGELCELEIALDRSPPRGDVLLLIEAASRAVAYNAFRKVYGAEAIDQYGIARTEGHSGSDLFVRILQDLATEGLAVKSDHGWLLASEPDFPPVSDLLETLLSCDPQRAPEAIYLSYLQAALPEILRGAAVRAANASVMEMLEGASTFAVAARIAISGLVQALREKWKSNSRLELLLVGAADPALIKSVAMAVPPSVGSVVVSDLRDDRLSRVHDLEVAGNVRFVPWNRVQSEFRDRFDIILTTGLLGEAADRDVTLARLAASLSEEGAIVFVERAPNIFSHMLSLCAGAADARWLAQPDALQPVFTAAGFAATKTKPLNANTVDALVITALKATGAAQQDGRQARAERDILLISHEISGLQSMLTTPNLVARIITGPQLPLSGSDDDTEPEFSEVLALLTGPETDDQSSSIASRCEMIRHVLESFRGRKGTLWLITRGCGTQPARPCDEIKPDAAALWGFSRVAANENPNVDVRLIDLSPALSDLQACSALLLELDLRSSEKEILITSTGRYGARLLRDDAAVLDSVRAGYDATARLEVASQGSLDRLGWQVGPRRSLDPDQVEIAVTATGLNFRDVMWALGLLPPDALEAGFAGATLGMECAGVVTRAGRNVTSLALGDNCVAFAPASFAQHVVVHEFAVTKLPGNLKLETAASIPVAFLTAYYSLKHLAQLKPGETVLIHGGAGGVGLAAIQIARWRGAIPIATAGSPEKQAFLKALGVSHVFHSRSLEFFDDVMASTEHRGVDVVLNSLAGEAMERSIDCLRPFGRFVELGKRDFFSDTRVGLRPFRKNLSYFGVDADQLLIYHKELARALFGELLELFGREELKPLPYRVFEGDEVRSAFRLMQQAGHVGKIVVRPGTGSRFARNMAPTVNVASDETHVIVGGFGGFGLALAKRLAARGARNLVLIGRRGATEAGAREAIEVLQTQGVTVKEALLDASDRRAMRELFVSLRTEMPPVQGIFHAAMVLDDALIENLTPARIEPVLRAKIAVAQTLDELSETLQLKWFVLFSSATTLVGNPGQGSYVAANCYLEALAERRRAKGLPALAIGWGAISDAGYLARGSQGSELLAKRLAKYSLRVEEALDALELMLIAKSTPPVLSYSRFDWTAIGRQLPIASTPLFELVQQSPSDKPAEEITVDVAHQLISLPPEKARECLVEILATEIAHILRIPAAQIDHNKPLSDIGVDSLMGIELKLAAEERLGFEIPLMSIGGAGSITDLAGRIVNQVLERHKVPAASKVEELVFVHAGGMEGAPDEIVAIAAAIETKEASVRRVF